MLLELEAPSTLRSLHGSDEVVCGFCRNFRNCGKTNKFSETRGFFRYRRETLLLSDFFFLCDRAFQFAGSDGLQPFTEFVLTEPPLSADFDRRDFIALRP